MHSSPPIGSTVLKVGHHGSRHSTSEEFLKEVSPQVAVISAGEANRFGHPHEETLEILGGLLPPGRILVTSEVGSVELTSDGSRLWLRTER